MKIALIANDYVQQFPLESYGGIETCVENLAQGLFESKIDFFVICPKRKNKKEYPFEVYETQEEPTSITNKNSSYYAYSVAKVLKNLKFDIIWSQSNWSIDPLLSFKKPIISTFHDSCEKQYGWIKNLDRIKYRFLSKFQFNNWINDDWEKNISFQLYTGIQNEDFLFENQKDDYFLWCGGLNWGIEGKGLDVFIELAKLNKDKKFIAYGAGNKDIENHLYNLNINNFYYKGKLNRGEEHKKVFSKAKALLMPTKIMDTLPRTCLEAVSKGTPIIGSNNGSIPEIINQTGGKVCLSLEEYSQALDLKFDYKKIFESSKIFKISEEISNLLKESVDL